MVGSNPFKLFILYRYCGGGGGDENHFLLQMIWVSILKFPRAGIDNKLTATLFHNEKFNHLGRELETEMIFSGYSQNLLLIIRWKKISAFLSDQNVSCYHPYLTHCWVILLVMTMSNLMESVVIVSSNYVINNNWIGF